MISFMIKLAIFIFLIVFLVDHWDAVAAFFGGIMDWILFYLDKIASGPSR